ncbi:MAG TPA: TrmH family RNA methyltransferase [Dermatophilaceae bacterium]|nr:TrmH family RNA methyltransferase [Dermatophilaceae bacterium]
MTQIGVGPWDGLWPATEQRDRYDEQLLAEGDRRNVVDAYRYWRHEAIVADLDTRRHELHVAIENWVHDANIGSIVRTANAVNVAGFHIVGRRRWNRRGAMVTDRYQHEFHHPSIADLLDWARRQPDDAGSPGLPVLGVDNLPGAVALETYRLPRRCLLVFGQEGPGLSEEAQAGCAALLSITQFGSTRSLNAGAAAAIAMHAWVRWHVFAQEPAAHPLRP